MGDSYLIREKKKLRKFLILVKKSCIQKSSPESSNQDEKLEVAEKFSQEIHEDNIEEKIEELVKGKKLLTKEIDRREDELNRNPKISVLL